MRPGRFGAVFVVAGALSIAVATSACTPCAWRGHQCEAERSTRDLGPSVSSDVVCRHEALTGSHIVERRCYRRSEMREREAQDRALMDRLIIQANRPVRNPAAGKPNPQ
jgi:hypothetical protein